MSLETNKYYLTNRGQEILGGAISGTPINVSAVKIGSDALPSDEESVRAMTALTAVQQTLLINGIVTQKGEARITVVISNDKVTTGYYARAIGVYVIDPKMNAETLFAVSALDDSYIPAYGISAKVNQIYTVHIVIGDAQVTVVGDGDLYLLKKDALTIDRIYPIGMAIPLLGDNDPNSLWPTTQWEKMAEGMAMISAGETYTSGATYGANEVTIEKCNLPKVKVDITTEDAGDHTHPSLTGISEAGFDVTNGGGDSDGGDPLRIAVGDNRPYHNNRYSATTDPAGKHKHKGTTDYLGDGQGLNVMQKSVAINLWKRIA